MKELKIKKIFILFVIIFFNLTYAQISTKSFEIADQSQAKVMKALINSNDSWSMYKLAPYLDSYNQMYKATKNQIYLDKGLDLITNVINNSHPSKSFISSQFKDKYKGWVNKSHEQKKNDGKEYPLFESYLWRYVTATLVIIKENNLVATYQKQYDLILNFSQDNIFNKWYSRGSDNILRQNTNMSALWAHISLNLWILTGQLKYKAICSNFNTLFMKNTVIKKNATMFWNSNFNKKLWTSKGQDVSHSNAEVAYIIDAYQKKQLFPKTVILNLINTLENIILKPDGTTALYLDGSGNGKGRIIDGFMKLGRFDTNLENKLLELKFNSPSEYYIKSQFIAVLLANNAILKI